LRVVGRSPAQDGLGDVPGPVGGHVLSQQIAHRHPVGPGEQMPEGDLLGGGGSAPAAGQGGDPSGRAEAPSAAQEGAATQTPLRRRRDGAVVLHVSPPSWWNQGRWDIHRCSSFPWAAVLVPSYSVVNAGVKPPRHTSARKAPA